MSQGDNESVYWAGRFKNAKAEWERVYQLGEDELEGRGEILERLEDELAVLSLALIFISGGE
jgi:hypothetical protein